MSSFTPNPNQIRGWRRVRKRGCFDCRLCEKNSTTKPRAHYTYTISLLTQNPNQVMTSETAPFFQAFDEFNSAPSG
jgi:hypothetical protein